MAFRDSDLDEIRSRIKISEVVQQKFKLAGRGNGEFVVADNHSFTVSDRKMLFHDFGNSTLGKATGDVFDFLQEFEGYSFVDAVKELAGRAGVRLEGIDNAARGNGAGRPNGSANGHDRSHDTAEDQRASGDAAPRAAPAQGKLEIVSTWDIVDQENTLLYQTVRRQRRLPDGSWQLTKEGKVWKTFSQRRPSPDNDGTWVWSLDLADRETGEPFEFMRFKDGWLRFNADNFEKWKLTERRAWPDAPKFEPWLYNANDVVDELQEPADEQRPIFFPEGEAKVDVLKEWGLLAVSATGGAKHFTESCAEFFRNAGHVIILQDNDRAGAERTAKVAPMLRAVGVKQVSSLNFRDVWPACPAKGDIKDWREKGGGTREQLLEIVDQLKPWTPEPYKSKFGAKTAFDLGAPARAYPWRIKNIVPRNDNMLIMGPSRSGKTFEALDMLMHVHDGETFAGRKVEQGGAIYLTYEGATGFENRLRAYLTHKNKRPEDLHSFAWLTRPPGIFASEDNVTALAEEIAKIAEGFAVPLACTVVDTHNAATRGSSEIKTEDINKILERYDAIAQRTGAPLWIVGHTNSLGKHRGNEVFFNGIEATLLVERVFVDTGSRTKAAVEKRDDDGRVIRRVRVDKQREGDDHLSWEFILKPVEIGRDEDGDPITSMVSVEPSRAVAREETREVARDKPEGFSLSAIEADLFKLLLKALRDSGETPAKELKAPGSVARVIKWADFGVAYKATVPQEDDETAEKYRNRIKGRLSRFRQDMSRYGIIGIDKLITKDEPTGEVVNEVSFIWPTGKTVHGPGLGVWPKPKKKDEPIVDQATGKPVEAVF